MRRSILLLAALTSMAAVAPPVSGAEVGIAVQGPVVELTVTETVKDDPDIATVGAGVTSRAATASAAMRENARKMSEVVARIKSLGVPDEKIQTTGISLNPRYDYRNDDLPRFLGYDATNNVQVELDDPGRIGTVLDALVEAGANNLSGPSFAIEDDTAARAQARMAAFERAAAQAQAYARMAGYSAVRLLAVEETLNPSRPMSYAADQIVVTGAARQETTPVEPGQVGVNVTLTAKYEMTR